MTLRIDGKTTEWTGLATGSNDQLRSVMESLRLRWSDEEPDNFNLWVDLDLIFIIAVEIEFSQIHLNLLCCFIIENRYGANPELIEYWILER
jgi:hypothetical protein